MLFILPSYMTKEKVLIIAGGQLTWEILNCKLSIPNCMFMLPMKVTVLDNWHRRVRGWTRCYNGDLTWILSCVSCISLGPSWLRPRIWIKATGREWLLLLKLDNMRLAPTQEKRKLSYNADTFKRLYETIPCYYFLHKRFLCDSRRKFGSAHKSSRRKIRITRHVRIVWNVQIDMRCWLPICRRFWSYVL